jgi:glycosyltransferase involved in cell wall biosynthesis
MEISVIVPTLNEEENIKSCLESILNQTFPREKYEIIVSDGFSSDKTVPISRKYADKVVITRKRGLWYGRNFGAKFAKGRYFIFIDADTIIDPNYLETIYNCFEEEYLGVSASFRFSGHSFNIKAAEGVCRLYYTIKSLFGADHLLGCNICVSKKGMDLTGGFRNLTLEDTGMADDLRKFGKIKYVDKKMVSTSSRRLEYEGVMKTYQYYIDLWLVQKLCLRPEKNKIIKHDSFKPFTTISVSPQNID